VGKVRTAGVWRWAGARDREERDLCQRVAVCFFKSRIMDDIFFFVNGLAQEAGDSASVS
jgi:hypothetical protein